MGISLELSRVRVNGKSERRERLKEAFVLLKAALENEAHILQEKRLELLARLDETRREVAEHEKSLDELRPKELESLRSRFKNEKSLNELSALQNSLTQEKTNESEMQEKQEVSVMR